MKSCSTSGLRGRQFPYWVIALLLALLILIYIGYGPEWIGRFSEPARNRIGFGEVLFSRETVHYDGSTITRDVIQEPRRAKTFWDWLQLLIVPAALAGIGFLFNQQQNSRAQRIESQRAQDTALQAYLDQMSELLDKGLHKEPDKVGDKRVTARARTLTVLRELGGARKRSVLQFLYEAQLINSQMVNKSGRAFYARVIELDSADLSMADLRNVRLSGADLRKVILKDADLRNALLSGANLSDANLSAASLDEADLSDADLSGARITEEQLRTCSSYDGATI
jgi:hypothetical protein